MNELIVPTLIFWVKVVLLVFWFKSRQRKDGKERLLCFIGFLLGQASLWWEVWQVKQTGQLLPGSVEQKMLMGRIALGASLGGVFTIIGLFYISFAKLPKRQ